MTWNYRVIRQALHGEDRYQIHEVYYNEEGRVGGWTADPIGASGDDVEELRLDLIRQLEACSKPTLKEVDGSLVEIAN